MNDNNNQLPDLPRLLILGQTFTNDTGGGITLSNLLKGWPTDKIAIAIESKEPPDLSRANRYYRLGYKELRMPFPFSLLQRKTKSGIIDQERSFGAVKVKGTSGLKFRLKAYFDNLLHKSGIFYWMYGNQNVSPELIEWIEDFKPQLIYYQPNAYKSIDFALAIKEHFQIPLVSHIMDDWFSFAIRDGLFKNYWKRQLDKKVKNLFACTNLHLSICKFMSEEYLKRYGYSFFPFHNCVNLDFWAVKEKRSFNEHTGFRILYAGRLGYGIDHVLLKIVDVIEEMGKKGIDVQLEIQTKDQQNQLIDLLNTYRFTKVSLPISYLELPQKFDTADALLIPADFDGQGLEFIRFSMPTKVSEYMATNTPIWVIGPPNTALTEYAKEGWAQLCLSSSPELIEASLLELIDSPKTRQNITQKANIIVKQNHDEKTVVSLFRKTLTDLWKNQHKEKEMSI